MPANHPILSLFAVAALTACGGSGSVGSPPRPTAESSTAVARKPSGRVQVAGDPLPRVATNPTCTGQRTFDTTGWRLALAGDPEPVTGPSELAYREGQTFKIAKLGTVPGTERATFHPLTISSTDTDSDGTVVFVASWTGNVDQPNHIGRGIYRLTARGVEAVVDAFTTVPGQSFRFNELGIPDVEHGAIAFWGGRGGGQWTGAYLWRGGTLITVADQGGSIAAEGTPDLRGGRVGFAGRDSRGPAAFIWSANGRSLARLLGKGEMMPDGKVVDTLFEVVLGDEIAAFAVGYDTVRDQRGIHMQRRILGWHSGVIWIVADPSWFKGPNDSVLYLDPNPVVDRDAVAFLVHAGFYSEVWVAEGCSFRLVGKSGDRMGGKQVRNFITLAKESFAGGQIELFANFTDGSQGYVRGAPP